MATTTGTDPLELWEGEDLEGGGDRRFDSAGGVSHNKSNLIANDDEESEYAVRAAQRVGKVQAGRSGAAEWVSESQSERSRLSPKG